MIYIFPERKVLTHQSLSTIIMMMMMSASAIVLRFYLVLRIITCLHGIKLQGLSRSKQLFIVSKKINRSAVNPIKVRVPFIDCKYYYFFRRLFPLSHWSLYSSSTDTKTIDTLPQLDPVLSNESATIITQQSIDKLTHLSKESLSDNNPLSELSLSFIKELEKVLNRKVDFATLNEFTTDICSWINPFISNIKEAAEEINKFSNFFSDTRIVVFNQRVVSPDTVEIDYQLSFWYPLPWRPRIIIPSVATIKFDRSVTDNKLRISSITEKWEV